MTIEHLDITCRVKTLALDMGFASVGVVAAGPVGQGERERFERWLAAGMHASMSYMAKHRAERFDPSVLVPGARSVLCLAVPYHPAQAEKAGQGQVAAFARGRDYHKTIKRQAIGLMDAIRQIEPTFAGRAFIDSAPLMERSLAVAAGIGRIGTSGCLIVGGLGSYVLLCEIVSNLELEPDLPTHRDLGCSRCNACVRACPTGALMGDGTLDARRCISYLTIEHEGPIEAQLRPMMGCRVFGCDVCQSVCPHNRSLQPADPAMSLDLGEVLRWDRQQWDAATAGTALRRASWEVLVRNAVVAAANSGRRDLAERLQEVKLCHPALSELVDWAIGRMNSPA